MGKMALSGLCNVYHKKRFPEPHIHVINPLLTKLVWSRWLDIGIIPSLAGLWLNNHAKKRIGPISSHPDFMLGQINPQVKGCGNPLKKTDVRPKTKQVLKVRTEEQKLTHPLLSTIGS